MNHGVPPQTLADRLRHSMVEHQADTAVEIPALGITLSYNELSDAANRWHALLGADTGVVVVHLGKCAAYYALLAACFVHGRSFCPIDQVNPAARVRQIVEQFPQAIIVTDNPAIAEVVDGLPATVVMADAAAAGVANLAASSAIEPAGASPRYYISTSGTTGTPKLVEVRHDATTAFVDWAIPFYGIDRNTRWGQFSSIGFDLSLVDFLSVLCGGGTLISVTTLAEKMRLDRFVEAHAVTHWHSVPTVVPYLLRSGRGLDSLRLITFCGEPLLRAQCQQLRSARPDLRIVNTYGPTEGTLFCTFHEVADADIVDERLSSMPVGVPIPGWNLVVVNDDEGERLIVVGEHLAEGYLGVDDPAFSTVTVAGARLRSFDTGDYIERRGAHVCFSHRRDRMVKVSGNRVDLGDVADALARAGIFDAIVLLVDGQLVAVIESARQVDPVDTISRLRDMLPPYAIPSRVISVEHFPRNANGKVDRGALGLALTNPVLAGD